MYVPVTDLIDVYTAGNGIALSGKVITAKVKANDSYIEVTTEGIASKGIDSAITSAKNAVIGTTDDAETAITLYGIKKYTANLVGTHESTVTDALKSKVGVETYNEFVENTNSAVSAIKVTDVDSTESSGVKLVKSESGVISVSVNSENLVSNLVGETNVVGPISGTTVKLGQAITDGTEAANEIFSANTSVYAVIQELNNKIQNVESNSITTITGDDYITVDGESTNKTLTINVAKIGSSLVDNSSALKVDANGKITLEWETVE